eukprot:6487340-Amphidinium_carterae.1
MRCVHTHTPAPACTGHAQPITAIAADWASLMAVTGGADCMVHLWDLEKGKKLTGFGLKGHQRRVTCIALAWPSLAVSGSEDGHLLVWNMDRGVVARRSPAAATRLSARRLVLGLPFGAFFPQASEAAFSWIRKLWV